MNNILFFAGLVALGYMTYNLAGLVGFAILIIAVLVGHVTEALVYGWKMDKREGQ
jgi:hypothetical protein